MIEGIIADNLVDLILGFVSIWFLTAASKQKIGWVVIVLYAMSLAGQSMEAEYITVGFAVHVIAFGLGALIAFAIRKMKARKTAK